MKTLLCVTVGVALLMIVRARASEFSKALSPQDFTAAGLTKLTPEELAHLDALVQAQRGGKTQSEPHESSIAVPNPAVSASHAQPAPEQRKVSQEMVAPQKREEAVVIAPGTKVSYREVETQLVGNFRGYQTGTILTLANGQRWAVTSGSYWTGKNDQEKTRKVVIKPGALGSFFLEIEDGGRPKVKLVGGNSSR